jgi:hypothetical protein
MKQFFTTVLFIFLSFASRAQQKEKDPFIGMDKNEVIKQFGQPTSIEHDTHGELLVYKRERSVSSVTGKTGTVGQTDTYVFQIDKKGKVYAWKLSPANSIKTAIAN